MPYLWLGYLLRNYVRDFTQYVNGFVALAALIVVIIVSRRYLISLVNNYVYPFMYPLAVLGIYACLYLAKILKKNNLFSTIFSLLGKESFFLMATASVRVEIDRSNIQYEVWRRMDFILC